MSKCRQQSQKFLFGGMRAILFEQFKQQREMGHDEWIGMEPKTCRNQERNKSIVRYGLNG